MASNGDFPDTPTPPLYPSNSPKPRNMSREKHVIPIQPLVEKSFLSFPKQVFGHLGFEVLIRHSYILGLEAFEQ